MSWIVSFAKWLLFVGACVAFAGALAIVGSWVERKFGWWFAIALCLVALAAMAATLSAMGPRS